MTEEISKIEKIISSEELMNYNFNSLENFCSTNMTFLSEIKEDVTKIFENNVNIRTDSQIRYSVLNHTDCPTIDSKYWQLNRELSAIFMNVVKSSSEYEKALLDIEELEFYFEELKHDYSKPETLRKIHIRRTEIELMTRKMNLEIAKKSANDQLKEMKTIYAVYKEMESKLEYSPSNPNEHQIESILLKLIEKIELTFYASNNNVNFQELSELLGLLKSFKQGAIENNIIDKISSKLTPIQLKILNEDFKWNIKENI